MRRSVISYLMVVLFLVLSGFMAGAQDKDSLMLHFRLNESRLDPSYMDNEHHLSMMTEMFKQGIVERITVTVSSSPDGPLWLNTRLSDKRHQSIVSLLKDIIPEEKLFMTVIPENWEGLINKITTRYFDDDKEEILQILKDSTISDDTRQKRLQALSDGRTWDFIKYHFLPELRYSAMVYYYRKPLVLPIPAPVRKAYAVTDFSHDKLTREPVSPVRQPSSEKERRFTFALKTNLLYDMALIPNLGVEFHLGKGWALGLDYNHAWWSLADKNYFWRVYGGGIDVRKYFGKASAVRPLSGHHLGLYAQAFTYDIETGGRGQMSDLTYSGGLEYGYSLPVGKAFNIDFGIGLGYAGGEYKVYDPEDDCYVWKETRQRHYMGPTTAEISLVWILGYKGKGGAR